MRACAGTVWLLIEGGLDCLDPHPGKSIRKNDAAIAPAWQAPNGRRPQAFERLELLDLGCNGFLRVATAIWGICQPSVTIANAIDETRYYKIAPIMRGESHRRVSFITQQTLCLKDLRGEQSAPHGANREIRQGNGNEPHVAQAISKWRSRLAIL